MLASADADGPRTPGRRHHDPEAPYLVPPIAERHRDPIVCELREALVRLYFRRGGLREPLLNKLGDIIIPAFGELLRRPQDHTDECLKRRGPKRFYRCDCPRPPDLFRRRSDGIESVIRVLLALASCTDWRSMEAFDPKGGYLSVWRLAELADLPCRLVEPDETDPRRRFRMDTVERALQVLRTARILPFTQQHREELEDGRHTSTAPACRKLSVNFFRKWGGRLASVFNERRAKLKRAAEKRATKAYLAGQGGDLEYTAGLRHRLKHPQPSPLSPDGETRAGQVTAPPRRRGEGQPPIELTDAIHEEHPEWTFGQIMAEARKRMRTREPPTSGSGEPPKTN
jgi:hypothetical protein